MSVCPPPDHQRRCLLPFEAEPEAVGRLRRAVCLQLAAWGATAFAEAASLAVSELATNVIRHVGAGAPATLVLETHENRLRVELHDTSATLPHTEQAGPDDEFGRGLALVAAVSDGWFATATPGGKAVCCEFTATGWPAATDLGIARGARAVHSYAQHLGTAGAWSLKNRHAARAVATGLVTDLLYWLAANGQDPHTVLDDAQTHFEAEFEARLGAGGGSVGPVW